MTSINTHCVKTFRIWSFSISLYSVQMQSLAYYTPCFVLVEHSVRHEQISVLINVYYIILYIYIYIYIYVIMKTMCPPG